MATQNILLNSSNIVQNSKNSHLIYKFPNPQAYNNASIAVHSLQLYYSWFNVNASLYNNNQFQYRWWNNSGNLNTTVTIVIPDGFYNATSLTLFLQSEMFKRGHYLTNIEGKQVYFIEFVENPAYYSIQLNLSPMFSSLPSGWTKGGSWGLPTTQATPILTILSVGNFKNLIGFNAGSYPPTSQSTLYQKISDYAPQLSPISSLIVRCNLARNSNALPDDVIYSFSSGDTVWGGIINEKPNELYYSPILSGTFDKIEITLLDQNFNRVEIIDPNILITLVIKSN
jgi:hypothetical protein